MPPKKKPKTAAHAAAPSTAMPAAVAQAPLTAAAAGAPSAAEQPAGKRRAGRGTGAGSSSAPAAKRPPPRPMPRPMPPHPLLCPPPHPLPPHPLPRPMQLSSQPGRPAGEAETEVQAEEAWVPARAPLPRQKRPPPRPMQQEVIHVLPDVLSCRAGSWIRYLQSQHRPAVLSQACRRHPAHA